MSLAHGGEAVGESCGGCAGGAGGASGGGSAGFIGRDSLVASPEAFSGVLAFKATVATRSTGTVTTAPSRGGDNSGGGMGKQTGKRDLMLSCGIADSDTGLEPTCHASLIQGNKVAFGHCIRSWG